MLSFCWKYYSNITQITKVLSLILPIILMQVGILGEVITSIITSCIFSGIGDCHGIMNFCCACLFMENKCNFHMKEKKDSVAILNALLQKHALSYSKWLLELHSWCDDLAQRANVLCDRHVTFANQSASFNIRANVFLIFTPSLNSLIYYCHQMTIFKSLFHLV